MKNLSIVIAGGTGFIGQALTTYFGTYNQIYILTRGLQKTGNNASGNFSLSPEIMKHVQLIAWDGKNKGEWYRYIDGADIVINLSGKSVSCRYTPKNKQAILYSRTNPTAALGEAIRNAVVPPKLWINAASATIYRHATDRAQTESNGEIKNDFSVTVCKLWEKTFFDQRTPFTRKAALRMAITLGNGGIMKPYLNLCKFGLGGKQGNGQQMFSWVHIEDLSRVIEFLWQQKELEGVFNVSSPGPVTNEKFMRAMRRQTGHSFGLPAPEWMLSIGAAMIGTETELLLKSRWVLPERLTQSGFHFKYTSIESAFAEVIAGSTGS